ncbi:MAG: OmpH family outer membrane protein [Bacteroidales bacterium]|nr:OmpH family outer membrane protein [Bacteroidales bacterium]
MKKYAFVVFIMCGMMIFGQQKIKIGHINSNDLMEVMPGRDSAEKVLNDYAKNLQDQLNMMLNEFQTKYQDYLENSEKYLEPVKKSKEKELVDLQTRIEEFRNQSQELLSKKEQELLQPLINKAKKAIEAVAKEKGYTYIFDTGVGVLLYYQDSDDIMPFVKEKLGIK